MSPPPSPRGAARSFLWRWGPPILWMGVISVLSTDAFSAEKTSRFLIPLLRWLLSGASAATFDLLHTAIRKGMHVAEFWILALLWYRGLRWDRQGWRTKTALGAFVLAAGFAVLDEAHQAFEPNRSGAVVDIGWDSLGAACGLVGLRVVRR